MKRIYFLIILLSVVCGVSAQETLLLPFDAGTVTNEQKTSDPDYVAYPVALKNEMPDMWCREYDCVEAVDLGLSVKWATCNIGAETPEEYGAYFAWGEIVPNKHFSATAYRFFGGSVGASMTKYNATDGLVTLEASDDAAAKHWGGTWRIPTAAELTELKDLCVWAFVTTINGVKGYEVTGPNGNMIFLPLAGTMQGDVLSSAGFTGYYWSNSLDVAHMSTATAIVLSDNHGADLINQLRATGISIRPVCQ